MYILDRLDNGIQVVMEKIPSANSVSIGVFVNVGVVKEDKKINGASHFIEHMLFKGTKNRTAVEIAQTIDNIGGQINAYTSTEYTCYYVKVLDKHISIAIELLSDMIINSLFNEEEIRKEKRVINEEIKMYLDSPEDLVYDLLSEIMFEGTPLSLPILGTYDTVNSLNRESLLEFYNKNYISENMVISIAGNFDYKSALDILNNYFNNILNKGVNRLISINPVFKQKIGFYHKNIEQLNFCLGMEGVKRDSDDLYPLWILNNIFGGSMSSKLFQKIREEKGLAYSIYSNMASFKDTGIFTIYAGLGVEQLVEVAKLINETIEDIRKNLITKDEVEKSKEQLKGNYILGMEGTFSRMLDIGKSKLLLGRIVTLEEVLEKIDVVTIEDIERIVQRIFNKDKYNIAYVGSIGNQDKIETQLKEIFFN
ncbi:M16 family metallopeptidase [Tepidimicrobium xylanilyticum]|uniref:Predicted Zn-dependent peptidase n=1 Tax=Tepidimicrobium xylanilyticum TaxID=1123352 RepID=A0A1H2YB66_9FIRM|nr:pitrilysin family protein [Tepidimicrobium xylanilyticum]GMG97088.1 peptidase M16 [Tepidimicrobium xylanilyticum]SDX02078.1 Predicted Zn-dependent peptidase [Tepidimicrobium xylanilyticum]